MFYSCGILICIGKFTLHKNCTFCQFQARRGNAKSSHMAPRMVMERLLENNFLFYRYSTKHVLSRAFSRDRPKSSSLNR